MIPIDDRLDLEARLASGPLSPEAARDLVERMDRDPVLANSMANALEHRWAMTSVAVEGLGERCFHQMPSGCS